MVSPQVAYTLWARFMLALSESQELSGEWARPVRLPFFEHNQNYLKSFSVFDLASKLQTEKAIKEIKNSCDDPNATVIQYDRCSDQFTSLWWEASKSMQVCVFVFFFAQHMSLR